MAVKENFASLHGSVGRMLDALNKQDKKGIFIRQPFGTDPRKSKYQDFCISGVVFLIRYGAWTMVPKTVYEVALQSGLIDPQTEEDVRWAPVADPRTLHYQIINGISEAAAQNMAAA